MAFKGQQTRWLYWGAWVLLGLFMATQDIIRSSTHLTAWMIGQLIFLNLAQNLAWGALSLITLRVARRFPLRADAPAKHWWVHLAASLTIVTVGLVVIASFALLMDPPKWSIL